MPATVTTCALLGIDAHWVQVEVDVAAGLPQTSTVGLPDHAVRESKDRVRAALRNSGYALPPKRVTINLAPGHLRKQGSGYDLPIALAILAAGEQIEPAALGRVVVAGELALDGTLRPIRGALSMAIAARRADRSRLLLPHANAAEAALVDGIDVLGVASLREAVETLAGRHEPARPTASHRETPPAPPVVPDLRDVAGQEPAKRALEVAAAGGHNLLLIGAPGVGKSMLARRLPGILPPLDLDAALEVTRVHSVAGTLGGDPLVRVPPFRAPHHTTSTAGLFGGGSSMPQPGELPLAHHGVLFLDELPEFRRDVLEGLRQPLEADEITIVRAGWRATYPTKVMLVGAMNPCPCGHLGDARRACRCTPQQLAHYATRVSGPLLDRIDLHVHVAAVRSRALGTSRTGEPSEAVRSRVAAARTRQRRRFGPDGAPTNARMTDRDLREHARPDPAGRRLLDHAMERLGLSARAYTRVLKVARTIADLAGRDTVLAPDVAEAIQYRSLDRPVTP